MGLVLAIVVAGLVLWFIGFVLAEVGLSIEDRGPSRRSLLRASARMDATLKAGQDTLEAKKVACAAAGKFEPASQPSPALVAAIKHMEDACRPGPDFVAKFLAAGRELSRCREADARRDYRASIAARKVSGPG